MEIQNNLGSEQFLRKKESLFRDAAVVALVLFLAGAGITLLMRNRAGNAMQQDAATVTQAPPPFDRIVSSSARNISVESAMLSQKGTQFRLPGDVINFVVSWEEETGPADYALFEGFVAEVSFPNLDEFLSVTPRMGEYSRHTRSERTATEIEYAYHRGPADVFDVVLKQYGTSTIVIIRQDMKR